MTPRFLFVVSACFGSFSIQANSETISSTWNGGQWNWANLEKWSPETVPNNTDDDSFVVEINEDSSTINITDKVTIDQFVFSADDGELQIVDGGQLEVDTARQEISSFVLADEIEQHVSLLVDGDRSMLRTWTVGAASDKIGIKGVASMIVRNGANYESANVKVGSASGGVGSVLIDGDGSAWTSQLIHLGDIGTGTLTIRAGAAAAQITRPLQPLRGLN